MTEQEYDALKEQLTNEYQQRMQAVDLVYTMSQRLETSVESFPAVKARKTPHKKVMKSHRITSHWKKYPRPVKDLVLDQISEMKEPFTSPQIADILKGKFPGERHRFYNASVSPLISALHRAGLITRVSEGKAGKSHTYTSR